MEHSPARRLELVPIDDLADDPRNPKGHDDSALDVSIDTLGYIEPIVEDQRTGLLISGHGRKGALLRRRDAGAEPPDGVEVVDGVWHAWVVRGWASTDDDHAGSALVALNSIGPRGGWVHDKLTDLLDSLAHAPQLVEVMALPSDLSDLLAAEPSDLFEPDGEPGDDDSELSAGALLALANVSVGDPEHTTETGQTWALGRHHLVVADVATGHHLWSRHLTEHVVFMPYAGPFAALGTVADDVSLVLVQPDPYIAGHVLDKWTAIHGADTVRVLS